MFIRALPLAAAISIAFGCGAGAQTAPSVTVAAAQMQDLTDGTGFVGRAEAIDRVDLVTRVTGFLREALVADGATVEAGDVLFRIEPDQYEAVVAAREADVTRAEANLELAGIELERRRELVARDATPQSQLDIARAEAASAEANLRAAQAALRQAQLDLGYTEITAPFDGRVGRIQRSVGELVGPGTGTLTTLVREQPIFVSFSVSEGVVATLQQQLIEAGASANDPPGDRPVFVDLPNGTRLGETGRIDFIGNAINPATGTLPVRARFPNENALLIDGGFVSVRIEDPEPTPRLTVPQAAMQRDQRGDFVLVVSDQNMVEQRYVTTGRQTGTDIVVDDGLSEGEQVIVEGLQRVRPGVPVAPVLAGTAE